MEQVETQEMPEVMGVEIEEMEGMELLIETGDKPIHGKMETAEETLDLTQVAAKTTGQEE